MEVKIEQKIKLKFGETEIELNRTDALNLAYKLNELLGIEKGTTITYPYIPGITIPWNTKRWDDNYPWRWNEPFYSITCGYETVINGTVSTGNSSTTSCVVIEDNI